MAPATVDPGSVISPKVGEFVYVNSWIVLTPMGASLAKSEASQAAPKANAGRLVESSPALTFACVCQIGVAPVYGRMLLETSAAIWGIADIREASESTAPW